MFPWNAAYEQRQHEQEIARILAPCNDDLYDLERVDQDRCNNEHTVFHLFGLSPGMIASTIIAQIIDPTNAGCCRKYAPSGGRL